MKPPRFARRDFGDDVFIFAATLSDTPPERIHNDVDEILKRATNNRDQRASTRTFDSFLSRQNWLGTKKVAGHLS